MMGRNLILKLSKWERLKIPSLIYPSRFGNIRIRNVEVIVSFREGLTSKTFDQELDVFTIPDEEIERLDRKAESTFEKLQLRDGGT